MVSASSASYHTPFHFVKDKELAPGKERQDAVAKGNAEAGKAIIPIGIQKENVSKAGHESTHGGSFLGFDAHAIMYYVSAVVGTTGIIVAFLLHYLGRTTAATSRADALVPAFGGLARGARRKWYVDEIYDAVIRTPLWVLSNVFHLIDKLIVDGVVNLFGWLPKALGGTIRPSQSGVLHGYAAGMAGGLALLLLIALWVSFA
jgi:NADH-quinone oxidoreductase subunit L